jgi:hypothetical protein
MHDVPSDGNCLFSSVADQILQETEENYPLNLAAKQLRKLVCDCLKNIYLKEDRIMVEVSVNMTLEKYIKHMSNPYVHGDYICLSVIATYLNRNIAVWNPSGNLIHKILDGDDKPIYNIIWIKGYNDINHFTSTRLY